MVRKSEANFLLRRAKAFLSNAEYLYSRGLYDLAAFNLEQAVQLLLKYKLLLIAGDYPRTHSIRRLFRILLEYIKDENLENFYLDNVNIVGDLESAYIAARYLPVEFERKEVENMIIFVKNLFKRLGVE